MDVQGCFRTLVKDDQEERDPKGKHLSITGVSQDLAMLSDALIS